MFAKIVISACILAVARAGLLAEPAYASYAAPAAIASYAAPAAIASYAAPAYASHGYAAQAYGGYGYGSHYDEHALAHTSENTYRSPGNLHTVSTQSRTIATPYSSSSKQFTKVTNPGIYAQAAYAAPIAHHAAYAAPIAAHTAYAAPIAHHAPLAIAAPIAAAPIAHHAAYAAPLAAHTGLATTYASHHGHGDLGHSYGHSTQSASLLGVAYSPAVGVSHVSYSSPIGINYGW